jgi:ribose 5-phosphate isomerase A
MNSSVENDGLAGNINYDKLSEHFFKSYLVKGYTIGLGSGRTVEKIVRNIANLEYKDSLEFIVTSLQIRIVSESMGLRIVEQSKNGIVDVVLDGADQIDSNYNMIKGGGGALLKEKILISSSQKFVIVAQADKFVEKFNMPVPVEVAPFGRTFVMKKLEEIGGLPKMRMLGRGYPFITENGNIIYDTLLPKYENLKETEMVIKNIPGVMEVGLFTNPVGSYYKITRDNDFELISPGRK